MHSLRVLEFEAILERLGAHCETERGRALSALVRPAFDEEEVWRRLSETDEAYRLIGSDTVPPLARVLDLRQALTRCSKGGVLGGEELYRIGELLVALRSVREFLRNKREGFPKLWRYAEDFPEAPKLEAKLLDSLESNGDVKDSASPALASLRKRKFQAAGRITERIQSYVSGKTREYLSDPIYTVRDGRFVLPVKSEHRGKIRGILHDTSASGQTVFVEPEDVLKLGNDLAEIEGQERAEVQRVLAELSSMAASIAPAAEAAIERAAELDLILAQARYGYECEGTIPTKGPNASVWIDRGRHPLLPKEQVVPVTIEVGDSFQGLLITGPNTGGKTVAIKCLGLCVLMAQSGLMPPARAMRLGPFAQVWADIGDEQSIAQSLSTFSGHIKNIAEALAKLQEGALALFDELGAGTDPSEGAALAKAVLLAFQAKGAKIVASTHYGELKAFAYSEPGFLNAAMEFDAKSLRPTYRLIMGAPGASHAMKIASRYGMPDSLIEAAKGFLGEQQQDVAQMLENLERAQKLARTAQAEADRRAHELKLAEQRAAQKLAEAEEIRRTVNQRAQSEIEETLRGIRLEAADLIEELKRSGGGQKAIDAARARLKEVQSAAEAEATKFRAGDAPPNPAAAPLRKGDLVRVEGYTQVGTLLADPTAGSVPVQMGPLKLTVDAARVRLAEKGESPEQRLKAKKPSTLQRAQTASTEISLRGMRFEDAERDLERFLDEAVLGNLHQIRIVHGKGEGILRKMVHAMLKRNRAVNTFRMGEPGEGGDGVTVATLR